MSIQLLIPFTFCLLVIVQSTEINSSKGQTSTLPVLAKQALNDEDYDLTDKKGQVEGSGVTASLDDYADEEIDEQLSKITASTLTTTIRSTSTTTIKFIEQKKNNNNNNNATRTKFDDLDANEFNEDYKDDLDDAVDYNELTTKMESTILSTTRSSTTVQHRTSLRVLFAFLTRPPIAAGILAGSFTEFPRIKLLVFLGLAIGILTSVVLLICIVQRFQKRQRNHSSYTTGLLYPNQYGYSKSPQEFYA